MNPAFITALSTPPASLPQRAKAKITPCIGVIFPGLLRMPPTQGNDGNTVTVFSHFATSPRAAKYSKVPIEYGWLQHASTPHPAKFFHDKTGPHRDHHGNARVGIKACKASPINTSRNIGYRSFAIAIARIEVRPEGWRNIPTHQPRFDRALHPTAKRPSPNCAKWPNWWPA